MDGQLKKWSDMRLPLPFVASPGMSFAELGNCQPHGGVFEFEFSGALPHVVQRPPSEVSPLFGKLTVDDFGRVNSVSNWRTRAQVRWLALLLSLHGVVLKFMHFHAPKPICERRRIHIRKVITILVSGYDSNQTILFPRVDKRVDLCAPTI